MKRYLSAFTLTFLFYIGMLAAFLYAMDEIKPIKISNEKAISLNHISLIQQKEIITKTEDIKKVKRVEKSEKIKRVQKQKEVQTVKSSIKKMHKPESKKVKSEVIEKKQVIEEQVTEERVALKKTVIKKDYKELYVHQHLKEIIVLIQKNIKYPKKAKRFNIQGEVIIEFTLTKKGEVINFKPIQGHRLLKKSTINAIKKASSSFPKVKKDLTLIVPVRYTLT